MSELQQSISETNNHHNVFQSRRRCSHCRQIGHNISVCQISYQAANILHESVLTIIRSSLQRELTQLQSSSSLLLCIKDYLKLHNLKELKLIVRLLTDVHIFARRLSNFNITERCFHLKKGLVKILTLYYYNNMRMASILNKKVNISTKVELQDNSEENVFHCPICIEDIENNFRLTTNCNHDVCFKCFDLYLDKLPTEKDPSCSLCRTNITELTFTSEECCKYLTNKHFT
jgi:hypothetical protein